MTVIGLLIMGGCLLPLVLEDSFSLTRRQTRLLLFIAFITFIIFTLAGWFPAMDS